MPAHTATFHCEEGHEWEAVLTHVGAGGGFESRFREPDEYEPSDCPYCEGDLEWEEEAA